jgi:hypothetical protein
MVTPFTVTLDGGMTHVPVSQLVMLQRIHTVPALSGSCCTAWSMTSRWFVSVSVMAGHATSAALTPLGSRIASV